MVFGGPSFFQVKQGVVTDYTYSEVGRGNAFKVQILAQGFTSRAK